MVFTPPQNQIPDDWLQKNGPLVHQNFLPFLNQYHAGEIGAAELCTAYVLSYLKLWRGKNWPNGAWSEVKNIENKSSVIQDLFCKRFRSVSLRAQRALQNWHLGIYPIELSFRVPSSMELLALQANGKRVLTLFVEAEKMARKNLERDPMTFVIHDLEHADEFFHDEILFEEQKKFYKELHAQVSAGLFTTALKDKIFKRDFEYVISDMNSHPAHLRATLEFLQRDYAKRKRHEEAS